MITWKKAIFGIVICVGLFWLVGTSILVDLAIGVLATVFFELYVKPTLKHLTK